MLTCIIVLSEHGATGPRKKSESLDPRAGGCKSGSWLEHGSTGDGQWPFSWDMTGLLSSVSNKIGLCKFFSSNIPYSGP